MSDLDRPVEGLMPDARTLADGPSAERDEARAFADKPPTGPRADWADHLDSDMKAVLDALSDLRPQAIETLTPEEARLQPTAADGVMEIVRQKKLDQKDDGVATRDFTIPGPGGELKARLYGPQVDTAADAEAMLPVVVYFHGGGFVIADLDVYDASPRALAAKTGCIVVSCDYRRAPEDPFPAAHDDAFAAYKWVVQNAASFGGDPEKIAVLGESAGGNLACNVSIRARDEGVAAPLVQVLVYPVAQIDMQTQSYVDYATAKPLNKPMMQWFVQHYLGGPEGASDPRINLVAANLAGLPHTCILNAEIDPLRDDGEKLEQALKAADVKVDRHLYSGVTHEFFGMGAVVHKAKKAEAHAAHELKKAFGLGLTFI